MYIIVYSGLINSEISYRNITALARKYKCTRLRNVVICHDEESVRKIMNYLKKTAKNVHVYKVEDEVTKKFLECIVT